MENKNIPSDVELPSTKTLIRSTVLAALVATILLITVVLPAEYAIDLTGVGRVLGLQQMGEIKRSLSQEAAAARSESSQQYANASDETAAPSSESSSGMLKHEMKVTLAPNEGTEIKVTMAKGRTVQYVWFTDGGPAFFDVHGDSRELDIDYHRYSKGTQRKSEGVIEAEFDGNHGWYWRNRTREAMTITLQTNGGYTDIKHMK